MPMVTCPHCKEQGRIPQSFVGKQIKCSKCGNRFLVTTPPAKAAAATAAKGTSTPADTQVHIPANPLTDEIAVEGIEAGSWSSLSVSPTEEHSDSDHGTQGKFIESPSTHPAGTKEYKLMTQRDKWFEGKFELPRMEEAINYYAKQGWTVRSLTSTQVTGFSGGPREELVVLFER